MGTRTPNMSIFKPAPGETVFDPAFAAGLDNLDSHDHSGAPNKGVQIGTDGIQDGAITADKLTAEVLPVDVVIQTTDATPTEADAISLVESQSITVTGRFVGLRNTATEVVGGSFTGTFYRPTGSSVTVIAKPIVNSTSNSAGKPYIQIVADTVNETVSIQVVGEISKTYDWNIIYNKVLQPDS